MTSAPNRKLSSPAFTLIELLVVIAIIAILAIVVLLTINPAQLIEQSRDSNRLSDLSVTNSALGIYSAEGGTSLGSSNLVYVSIPDPSATSSAGDQCQGLGLPIAPSGTTYFCAASSSYRRADGTGWIPLNASSLAGGSPLGSLPQDPVNQTSSDFYYTYATNGNQYQLGAHFESQKYVPTEAASGGADPAMYTAGTNLFLAPYAGGMVGWWPINEGSGTTAFDASGYGNNFTTTSSPTWVGGNGQSSALSFSGSNYAIASQSALPAGANARTTSLWFKLNATGQGNNELMGYGVNSNGGRWGIWLGSGDSGCAGTELGLETAGSGNDVHLMEDTNWHYVAFVLPVGASNLSQVLIYLDGTLQSPCHSSSITINTGVTELALATLPSLHFDNANATIDNVRIYNRALSASEITAIYSSGK